MECFKTYLNKTSNVKLHNYTLSKGMKSSTLTVICVAMYRFGVILSLEIVGSNTSTLKAPCLISTKDNKLYYPFDMNSPLGNMPFFNYVLSYWINENSLANIDVYRRAWEYSSGPWGYLDVGIFLTITDGLEEDEVATPWSWWNCMDN